MPKIKLFSLYLVLCIAVGVLAKSRGRSGLGWAALALCITPLIAGGIVLLIKQGSGTKSPWW